MFGSVCAFLSISGGHAYAFSPLESTLLRLSTGSGANIGKSATIAGSWIPVPWGLGSVPWALGPGPYALGPAPGALDSGPWALDPWPWALGPRPWTLDPGERWLQQ